MTTQSSRTTARLAPTIDAEVQPSSQRLSWTAAQKLALLAEYEAFERGSTERGAFLRRNRLYSSHISWSSPTTPTPLEVYPALAFDRLFKDEAQKGDKSVLDAVLEDARDVRRRISSCGAGRLVQRRR